MFKKEIANTFPTSLILRARDYATIISCKRMKNLAITCSLHSVHSG